MKTIEQTALDADLNKALVLSFVRETYPSATLQTSLTKVELRKLISVHKPLVKTKVDPATLTTPNQTTTDAALVIDREQQFNFSTRGDNPMSNDNGTYEKAKRAWDSDPGLQRDFGTFEAYLSYVEAETKAQHRAG